MYSFSRSGWVAGVLFLLTILSLPDPAWADPSVTIVADRPNSTSIRFLVTAEWSGRSCDVIPNHFWCRVYKDGTYYGSFQYGPCCEWGWTSETQYNIVTFTYSKYYTLQAGVLYEGAHVFSAIAEASTGAPASSSCNFDIAAIVATTGANNGAPPACPNQSTANPVNVTTGNKWEEETDFSLAGGPVPLVFRRMYNSQSNEMGPLGFGWSHNFASCLAEIEVPYSAAGLSPGTPVPNLQESNNKFTALSNDPAGSLVPTILFKGADGRLIRLLRNPQDSGLYTSIDNLWTLRRLGDGNLELKELDGGRQVFSPSGRLLKVLSGEGYEVNLSYDGDGRLSQVTDTLARTLFFVYNTDGLLEGVSDSSGRTFTYGYQDGNLTSVTQPDSEQVSYAYADPNDPHNLTSIIDQNGHLKGSWTYNSQDRVVHYERAGGVGELDYNYSIVNRAILTNSLGRTTAYYFYPIRGRMKITRVTGSGCESCGAVNRSYNYDGEGNLSIIYDGKNVAARLFHSYDAQGNPQVITEPLQRQTRFTYHPLYPGLTLSRTTAGVLSGGSKVVTYDYDADGNGLPNEAPGLLLRRLIEEGRTSDLGGVVLPYQHVTTLSYNAWGGLSAIDGPRTDVSDLTTLAYYPNEAEQGYNRGMLQAVTTPAGTTTYQDYTVLGKPQRITLPDGAITDVAYDAMGRVTDVTRAGRHTGYIYDGAGNLTQVNLPGGGYLAYTYDEADQLIQVQDATGQRIDYAHDTEGNRTAMEIRDPAGTLTRSETYEYDAQNRLYRVIQPGGAYRQFGYDANNNRTSARDENGRTTTYGYDQLDRLISVAQPGAVTTGYGYDSADDLVSVTDAEGHTTTYLYDDGGRLVNVLSPDTGSTNYAYDGAGNLLSKLDAGATQITYAYDAANRLTLVAYPDSRFNVAYTYDAANRLSGMQDPSGSYTYTYDAAGDLTQEAKTILGVNYATSYAYNLDGVPTSLTHPGGRIIINSLDAANRISRVQASQGGLQQTLADAVAYLPFGPVTSYVNGNGLVTSANFDASYRITNLAAGGVLSYAYGHDAAGNITAITNALDTTRSQTFGYDALDRLTSASGIYGSIAYTYDGVGNRLTEVVGGQTDTYTYQAGTNRLAQVSGAATTGFAYDANGSTTQMGEKSFVYGQNTRLIQALSGSSVVGEYTYNGAGQRVIKTAGGETTVFHYDQGGNLIAESKADGTIVSSFVYLNDQRLARIDSAQEFTLAVRTDGGAALPGLDVCAFTAEGADTGKSGVTDSAGLAHFEPAYLPEGSYKFRVDYLGGQYWSPVVDTAHVSTTTVTIATRTVQVAVTTGGGPAAGATVYLFSDTGSDLGVSGQTDAEGLVSFELPVGTSFRFRADFQGVQYWSDSTLVTSEGPLSVIISNRPPVLSSPGDQTVAEMGTLSLHISGSDPDSGQTLTYGVSSALPEGAAFDPATQTFTWTPGYGQQGSYQVTFTLTDGEFTASQTITIAVTDTNAPPVLAHVPDQEVWAGQTLSFTVSATDPDGNQLTYSAGDLPTGASFDPATRTFTWTPGYEQVGSYQPLFTVTDDGSPLQSDWQRVTITVSNANRPPVLTPIGGKAVNEGEVISFTVTGSDPDPGDTLTYSASNLPTGASFDPATQIFTWTPDFGQAGTYQNVLFTVTDNGTPLASASEAITISVGHVNRPSVLSPIGSKTVNEGQTLGFYVTGTDPDVGDSLTYSASNLPAGASFDPATQAFTWTPGYDQSGNYQGILFTVTDNGTPPLSASEAVTISVGDVNRPPVLSPIGNKTVYRLEMLTFTVTAMDLDGGQALTYSAANLPPWARFEPSTQTFSWMPIIQGGEFPDVTFTVTDNGTPPASTSEAITITVPNRPPNVPSNPRPADGATDVGYGLSLSWDSSDPDGDNLSGDLYFGTSPSALNLTEDYQTDSLAPNTQYYWQVVLRDGFGGQTTGPVWTFTRVLVPYIDSISPTSVRPGYWVYVYGWDFGSLPGRVKLCGHVLGDTCGSISYWSNTEIRFVVPMSQCWGSTFPSLPTTGNVKVQPAGTTTWSNGVSLYISY